MQKQQVRLDTIEFRNFGFKIQMQIRFAYIWYSNLRLKFVRYFHLVKIGNAHIDVVVFVV